MGCPPFVDAFFSSKGYYTCLFLCKMQRSDFLVSFIIETHPTRTKIPPIGEQIQQCWIFQGYLHSIVSSRCNHINVGGAEFLSSPLPRIKEVTAAVAAIVITFLHFVLSSKFIIPDSVLVYNVKSEHILESIPHMQ